MALDHEEWIVYWRELLPAHLKSIDRIADEHRRYTDTERLELLLTMQIVLLNLVLSTLTPDDEPWRPQ